MMLAVADESVDFGLIIRLRELRITVLSVTEENSGINDAQVLKIAIENQCLLITEDKDFGELTHRLKLDHKGILLIRLIQLPRTERIELVAQMIVEHFSEFSNSFSVIDNRGVRIKTNHNRR